MGLNKKIWIALLVLIFGFLAAGAFVWKRYIRAPWDDEYAYTKGLQEQFGALGLVTTAERG